MTQIAPETDSNRARSRGRIIDAASRILQSEGPTGVTTRAVAAAAGVQAPTIYRLFGDKDGLLDAVAEHTFATYVHSKAHMQDPDDPVLALRAGWDAHIGFGLANPALTAMLADPLRRTHLETAADGLDVLRARVRRVASAGRLRVSEQRAIDLVHATGTGVVLTLLATPVDSRDLGLADAAYEMIAAVILTASSPHEPAPDAGDAVRTAAVTLRSDPDRTGVLTGAESALMRDWLDRIIAG